MFVFINILSALRFPLAFFFLSPSAELRAVAIVLAMLTDFFDGFLARRFRHTSQLGAVLDPLSDKFFVLFALIVFILESKLTFIQMAALLCRDFAVLLFGLYLYATGEWAKYQFRAIWCGKVTTTLQFFVMLALTFQVRVPATTYWVFALLGFFALIELYLLARPTECT